MDGKLYRCSRNALAVVGLLAILAAEAYFALDSFSRGRGAKTALKAATAVDSSVKATFYQIDVGAVGATRIYMAFSHATVDGSERGEAVLTPSTWKGTPAKSHVTGRRTGSLRLITGQVTKSNTQSRREAA
jgi:hypothetical protein